MKVDLFDFDLPKRCIAAAPAEPRDSARMLEIAPTGLNDYHIHDLPTLLTENDLLVLNNTRVIPAQLTGKRDNATIHCTLHQRCASDSWKAFVKPAKKLRPHDTITFADTLHATVTQKNPGGEVTLQFNHSATALNAEIERHGSTPLPPYIPREHGPTKDDIKNYQTIYAAEKGAVAAPTAGLHFTENLFAALKERRINHVFLTLHVGAGTFLPVKADDTKDHQMHSEHATLSPEAATLINDTKARGGRIIAVGTTSLRTLESAADENGIIHPFHGETNLFITPGFHFTITDMLLTNFHLPRSTLFMLVSAFAGLETMHAAYQHAITTGYRFYSYGDACLLHRNTP